MILRENVKNFIPVGDLAQFIIFIYNYSVLYSKTSSLDWWGLIVNTSCEQVIVGAEQIKRFFSSIFFLLQCVALISK